jgi:hypothetical protein
MDHDPEVTVVITLKFDEVISSSERAELAICLALGELAKREMAEVRGVGHVRSRGGRGVPPHQDVDLSKERVEEGIGVGSIVCVKAKCGHAAADVTADRRRVENVACTEDGADAQSGREVNVGHDRESEEAGKGKRLEEGVSDFALEGLNEPHAHARVAAERLVQTLSRVAGT